MDTLDNSSSDCNLNGSCLSTSCLVGGIAISVTRAALVIPLYVFVLYLGLQQWRQQRSFKSASHSDIFTFHKAALELIWILAVCFNVFGADVPTPFSKTVAYYFSMISGYGDAFFHVLTCVERYLAVVHPVKYLKLRNARGVRMRNISIACVWILSVGCSVLIFQFLNKAVFYSLLVLTALCLVAVSFCSLSVLYVLIRPGPGEAVQDRKQADQAKQRAFFTITAISVVLWLYFGGIFTVNVLVTIFHWGFNTICALQLFAILMSLPPPLVLPLLYLHRAGKLSFCCPTNV